MILIGSSDEDISDSEYDPSVAGCIKDEKDAEPVVGDDREEKMDDNGDAESAVGDERGGDDREEKLDATGDSSTGFDSVWRQSTHGVPDTDVSN